MTLEQMTIDEVKAELDNPMPYTVAKMTARELLRRLEAGTQFEIEYVMVIGIGCWRVVNRNDRSSCLFPEMPKQAVIRLIEFFGGKVVEDEN